MTLRPFTLDDVPTAAAWGLDAELCRIAEWTPDQSLDYHRRHWTATVEAPPPELIRLAAVYDGALVGYVDLHGTEPDRRELGYVIGARSRWGRGLGTAAARAGLDHAFDRLGLAVVTAEALAANERSVRILQRLGMIETGRGDDAVYLDRPTHYRQFMITREDWPAGRPEVTRAAPPGRPSRSPGSAGTTSPEG